MASNTFQRALVSLEDPALAALFKIVSNMSIWIGVQPLFSSYIVFLIFIRIDLGTMRIFRGGVLYSSPFRGHDVVRVKIKTQYTGNVMKSINIDRYQHQLGCISGSPEVERGQRIKCPDFSARGSIYPDHGVARTFIPRPWRGQNFYSLTMAWPEFPFSDHGVVRISES